MTEEPRIGRRVSLGWREVTGRRSQGQVSLQNRSCGEPFVEGGRSQSSLVTVEEQQQAKGFDLRAIWQVTSMSLGIGIFVIPYSFLKLGAVSGALWVLLMGCLACIAQFRILDVAAGCGVSSYEGLAEHAFGAVGKVAMAVITALTTFIATLSYLSSARELLTDVAVAFFIGFDVNSQKVEVDVLGKDKTIVMLCVLVAMVLPRCMSKNMGDHAWISLVGVITMTSSSVFFIVSCIVTLSKGCDPACVDRPPAVTASVTDTLQYIATLAFSFSMIFAVFPVLEERIVDGQVGTAVASLKKSVAASVGLCSCIYILAGLAGVYAFGPDTQSLALNNLKMTGLTQFFFLGVGTATSLLVAIVSFPVLASVEFLAEMVKPVSEETSGNRRPIIVCVIGVLVIVIDSVLPTKIAFALAGSLGLATAAYIMPCLLFLKLDQTGSLWGKISAYIVILFGCILLFASTPVTVWVLLKGESGAAPEPISQLLCPSLLDSPVVGLVV